MLKLIPDKYVLSSNESLTCSINSIQSLQSLENRVIYKGKSIHRKKHVYIDHCKSNRSNITSKTKSLANLSLISPSFCSSGQNHNTKPSFKAWYGTIINKIKKPLDKSSNKIKSFRLKRTTSSSMPNLENGFQDNSSTIIAGDRSNPLGLSISFQPNDPYAKYDQQLSNYNRSIEEAQLHCDLNEELVVQNGSATTAAATQQISTTFNKMKNIVSFASGQQEDHDELDEQIETNFNHMNSCLHNLKKMGIDMQEELDIQTGMIGDLQGAINKVEDDTAEVTNVMRRFEV